MLSVTISKAREDLVLKFDSPGLGFTRSSSFHISSSFCSHSSQPVPLGNARVASRFGGSHMKQVPLRMIRGVATTRPSDSVVEEEFIEAIDREAFPSGDSSIL